MVSEAIISVMQSLGLTDTRGNSRTRRRHYSYDDHGDQDEYYGYDENGSPRTSRRRNMKSSSFPSSRNNRRERFDDYNEYSRRTVHSVEKIITEMFGSCTQNIKTFFDDSPTYSKRNRHRSDTTATTEQSSSSRSKSQGRRRTRPKSMPGRNRRRSSSRKPQEEPTTQHPVFSLGKNAEIAFFQNDDVSALSGDTLEEMARRHSQMQLFQKARKGFDVDKDANMAISMSLDDDRPPSPVATLSSKSSDLKETIDTMENKDAVNSEDANEGYSPTIVSGISKASSTTTEFESIWKRKPDDNFVQEPLSTFHEPIFEEASKNSNDTEKNYHSEISAAGPATANEVTSSDFNMSASSKFRIPPPRGWGTPSSRKLRRSKYIGEIDTINEMEKKDSESDIFELNEGEI